MLQKTGESGVVGGILKMEGILAFRLLLARRLSAYPSVSITNCTTWECVNSFANWLSAIATILISGVALWLSLRDRQISMKTDISVGLVPGESPMLLDRKVFIISFTNTGPRPVTITNHGWKLPLTRGSFILFPNLDPEIGRLCATLPLQLTDGKTGHFFYHLDFFQRRIENPARLFFPPNWFSAWIRINFFRVYLQTSIGTQVRVRVTSGMRKELWRQYTNVRTIAIESSTRSDV